MSHIKRIITTVTAQFNELVDQVENHQAITESALRKFRADIREAKTQARLLEKESQQALLNKEKALKDVETWTQRAKKYANEDRDKALECVKRLKLCEKEVALWGERSQEINKSLSSLKNQLHRVESQYQELRSKQRNYTCREYAAKLKSSAAASNCIDEDCIQDVFDRWDRKIIKNEIDGELDFSKVDNLSIEIEQEQERIDLEATLDDLVTDEKK
ncbi:MAG: PspA/IM30 family protein [Bdellovibrionales bacterium]|nr:PspA/IM30 family protein [Bdellovibrionales bacterium]